MNYYPDGLTPAVIDALLAECWDLEPSSTPPSSTRERRGTRRTLAAVVRALPTLRVDRDDTPEGGVAA